MKGGRETSPSARKVPKDALSSGVSPADFGTCFAVTFQMSSSKCATCAISKIVTSTHHRNEWLKSAAAVCIQNTERQAALGQNSSGA
eukprot:6204197-Pleurochrysis_carterae.AAC.1